MAFIGAKALLHGDVTIAHCRGDALDDAATHELAKRIVVEINGDPNPNAMAPQRVQIELRGRETLKWHCETMFGNPAHPLSRERHLRKAQVKVLPQASWARSNSSRATSLLCRRGSRSSSSP